MKLIDADEKWKDHVIGRTLILLFSAANVRGSYMVREEDISKGVT